MWGLLRTLVAYSQIWEGLYSSGGPWLVFREGPLLAADIYAMPTRGGQSTYRHRTGWLDENGSGLDPDLTVEELGKFFDRSPVTIHGWIRDGRLRAYLFQGREYRVCESALKEFQRKERGRGEQ